MKKLSLGKLKLLEGEVLDRNQLAHIYGGDNVSQFNCIFENCWHSCVESHCCCEPTYPGSSFGLCVDKIAGQCP